MVYKTIHAQINTRLYLHKCTAYKKNKHAVNFYHTGTPRIKIINNIKLYLQSHPHDSI